MSDHRIPDRVVWMYWEDVPRGTRPPYLDLCLETIRLHAGDADIRLVDRESALELLPDIPGELWDRLPSPVYRSDYARTRLVHRYGGLWLDSDVIAMSQLSEFFACLDLDELVGWGWDLGGRFYNGLFAGRPGGAVLGEWIRQQDEILSWTSNWDTLPWAALGQDIMWPLARRTKYRSLPSTRIAPVPWYAWRQFLSKVASPRRTLVHRPWTVMLYNSVMGPSLDCLSRDELLRGQMLLSRLLRIGLGLSSPEQEMDAWTRLHVVSDIRFSTGGRSLELRARRLLDRFRRSESDVGKTPAR